MKRKTIREYRTKKSAELDQEIKDLYRKKEELMLGKPTGKMSVKELRATKKAIAALSTIRGELARKDGGAYNRKRKNV